MISRKTFNHQLNEEILTIKLNTNEQILKKALMGLFETKAAKVIKETCSTRILCRRVPS